MIDGIKVNKLTLRSMGLMKHTMASYSMKQPVAIVSIKKPMLIVRSLFICIPARINMLKIASTNVSIESLNKPTLPDRTAAGNFKRVNET